MTVIKKALKIFWITLVAVVSFMFAVALLLQLPRVQTFIAGKVVERLDEKLDADIRFEKIHLHPFRTLIIKNIEIIDRNPVADASDPNGIKIDTFFRAEYIAARFTFDGLFRQQGLHLDDAVISNAQMNLVLEDKPDEGDGDTSTDNLSRIFRLKKPKTQKNSEKEIFHINDVEISGMRFTMRNHGADKLPYHGGINWDDLDVRDISIKADDLKFKGGIMSGTAENISFREKSGYTVENLTGSARVGRGRTIVENLDLKDPWSHLYLPLYMMSYKNVQAFQDFIAQVRIDAEIKGSLIDFKTLTYFAPQLGGNRLKMGLTGKVSGTVEDFRMNELKFATEAGGFSGTVNGMMRGLPEIEDTRLTAKVDRFNMTSDGLGMFLSEWMQDEALDLGRYAKGHTFMVNALVDGLMNNLHIDTDIYSLIGRAEADVMVNGLINQEIPVSISGTASTENLDLGEILSSGLLGPITLRTGLKAEFGEKTSAKIDSLFVDRLHLNRYDYRGIKATGALSENMFNGTIIASDPNLNFILQGGFALSAKTHNARYKFYANITDADLNAINIDKRGRSKLRFETNANFTKTGKGNILGNIDIADLVFVNRDSTSNIGNINLTSHSADDVYKIRLRSQFADGSYTGTAPVTRFIKDLQDITLRKETPAMFKDPEYKWDGHTYTLDFITHDSMGLLSFLMPGMYINRGTKLSLNIDRKGQMTATLDSKRIAIGNNYIKDVTASFDNLDDAFTGELSSQEAEFAGMILNNNSLKFLADDNHVGASYSYDNQSDLENRGELVINAALSREEERLDVLFDILPSALHFNSKEWRIQPASIALKGKNITIDSFEMISGDERIYAYGSTSMTQKDTLTLSLDRFDISVLNPLLGSDFGIGGAATGNVKLTSPIHSKGLLADMLCDSTYIAGEPLGTLTIGSVWNEDFERFELSARNDLGGKANIHATAKLTPKSRILDALISLDSLSIKYAEPFLTDVFSEMTGSISGDIMAEGPIDRLDISSMNTRLDDAMLKVDFTNVPYYADGAFHIDDTGVYFDDIRIRDRFNGTGEVTGNIGWDRFKDITFDTRIKVSSIEGIDLAEGMDESFYGNIFGTGNVSITGPMNSLTLAADAVTAKRGQLHIPMSGAVTSGGTTNLLKFKELKKIVYVDPYEEMRARLAYKEKSRNDFFVKLRIDASPNVEVFVEIDKASGNVLSGTGNGLIELEIGEDMFNINGDYTLTGGKYNFSALGLVNREFNIEDGSSINFSGDIMASTLDIDAVYNTKVSLAPLLSDENSVSNRRNVECGIAITDRLSNPKLQFSIEIPDLNPMVKSRVESALSTEDKVQKQFLSLLLTNSFLPDEQSGIANNSSMLYSNVTEAMANQLSNILHKLDIPLDLGLKYQPTDTGTDIFDVAVSTQLFNNRVVVNGNIGNKEYSNGGNQNDVVGDLDIEIKLNRSGAFRLNLFSHSADLYSNYLDNSQRNGVGLTYQTEFNSMRQFFRNIFSSKAKRQEAKLAEQQAILDEEKVDIKINRENNQNHD
ncbi:MAG: translocation/assembly module TamB [Bacteroidales bacterium]|nr:translocation/assembly module TamB [Bacteroidales bacterium]